MPQRLLGSLVLAFGLLFTSVSDAQLPPGLPVNVTVGMDSGTREYLQGLPDNVRKAIIDAIQQSLTLVDISVDSYLERLDGVLKFNIDEADCSLTGLATRVNVMKRHLLTSEPVALLKTYDDDKARQLNSLTRRSSRLEIDQVYGDILDQAAATQCALQISVAKLEAKEREDKIEPAALMWLGTKEFCDDRDTAQQCLDKEQLHIKELVAQSDKHDLDASKASLNYQQLTYPSTGMFSSFDIAQYTDALLALARIESSIAVARQKRLVGNDLDDATELLKKAEPSINLIKADLTPTNGGGGCFIAQAKKDEAQRAAADIEPNLVQATAKHTHAMTLDNSSLKSKSISNIINIYTGIAGWSYIVHAGATGDPFPNCRTPFER